METSSHRQKKSRKKQLLYGTFTPVPNCSTCSSRSSTFLCQLSRALLSSCSLLCASWESAEALSSSCSSFSSSRSFLHSCLQSEKTKPSVFLTSVFVMFAKFATRATSSGLNTVLIFQLELCTGLTKKQQQAFLSLCFGSDPLSPP